MLKITLMSMICTISIVCRASEANRLTSDVSPIIAESSIEKRDRTNAANQQETLTRNKRYFPHYNYNNPDQTTLDGFFKHLVVLLNDDKIATLKLQNFMPEFTLTLPDNQFQPGEYTINGITIVGNGAVFVTNEVIPLKEETVHTQTTTLRAGNRDEDKLLSGAYSDATTDTFSFKFGQKISVKAGFKIEALASFEVTGELNAEQTWTKAVTRTITASSQFTKVKANHKKDITYTLFKGKSLNRGFIRSKIDPSLKINTFFTKLPGISFYYQRFLSVRDLVDHVKNVDNNLFNSSSLISKEGNDLFLNIPCELTTESSRLDVIIGDEVPY